MKDMREFLSAVVEYVELTDQAIGGLRKQATEAKAPAFSDEALTKTADALVQAGLLSLRAVEVLVQSFRAAPDKALDSLRKVAAQLAPSARGKEIGTPAVRPNRRTDGSQQKRESDRQFEKDFRLN
jgi:hypothetical protein